MEKGGERNREGRFSSANDNDNTSFAKSLRKNLQKPIKIEIHI